MKTKILILLLLILAIVSLLPGREGYREERNLPALAGISDKESMSSFLLTGFSETGEKKWLLRGQSADILKNFVILNGVNAVAYGEETEVTITAERGRLDRTNNNIHLEENVVARTSDGATVTSDYVDWNDAERRLKTDAICQVNKDNITAVGLGAEGRPEENSVKLNKDVVVTIEPEDAGSAPHTVITCDGPLEVLYQDNIAIFYNNVQVDDQRGTITADQMTVYFDEETRKIVKVKADGNVKIAKDENITYGEQCIYTTDDGKILMTGGPGPGGGPKIEIYEEEEAVKEHEVKE